MVTVIMTQKPTDGNGFPLYTPKPVYRPVTLDSVPLKRDNPATGKQESVHDALGNTRDRLLYQFTQGLNQVKSRLADMLHPGIDTSKPLSPGVIPVLNPAMNRIESAPAAPPTDIIGGNG